MAVYRPPVARHDRGKGKGEMLHEIKLLLPGS